MKKHCTLLILTFFIIFFYGCVNNNITEGTRKLIGITIIESTTPIENTTNIDSIKSIDINGFYLSDDYSEMFSSGNIFNTKFEYSYLEGDIVTPDSLCVYYSSTYYQAQTITTPIYLYEIYKTNENKYELVLKDQITNMAGNQFYNVTNEVTMNSYNYVLTYVINIEKYNTPVSNKVFEFNDNNELIKTREITLKDYNYYASANTAYLIIEERIKNENDEEEVIRTLLTVSSSKKYYTFKIFNNNKINGIVTKFIFSNK